MVKKQYQIVWTKRSQKHLDIAYKYISKDSPQNAKKVIEEIIKDTARATDNPELYAADKFKAENDGSYHAFEKHHYRIAYRFTKNIIRVLRVRHTKMEPKVY